MFIPAKHFQKCLDNSKHSINVSSYNAMEEFTAWPPFLLSMKTNILQAFIHSFIHPTKCNVHSLSAGDTA